MTITKIATATAEITTALGTINLTVPTGVTTSHFGVIMVGTAAPTTAPMTATGWTSRVSSPAGQGNTDAHFFTRLGGVAAGNTVTINVGNSVQNQMAVFACWYDTQGRDVATVGTVYTRNATTLSTTQFPGVAVTGASDMLIVGLDRTAGSPVVSSWSPSTPTVDAYILSTDRGTLALGGLFAHFVQSAAGTTATYTATMSASGSNAVGIQFALAAPANTAPIANAGVDLTVEPWSTVTLNGVDTDTENNVTTRAWSQTGVTTTLQTDTFTGTNGAAPSVSNFSTNPSTGATATIQSNQLRLQTGNLGSYNDNMRVTSSLPVTPNGRITLDVTPTTTTEAYFIVLVRAQNKAGSLGQDGYKFEVGSWGGITISKLSAYSGTAIGSSVNIAGYAVNVPIHLDMSFTGNAFQMSAWTGSTQPATPMISVTDSTSTYSTGYIGMYLNGGSAANAPATWLVDNWSVTSPGTGVTLTNANTATATFPAPATIAGSSLTFQYTATDSGGLSSSDTMVVTVLPVTERAVIGGVEVPMRIMDV